MKVRKSLHSDTLDKVFGTYFALVCAEPFTYKGRKYEPSGLQVSPMIFRELDCPANCGACCYKFTLDYLPHEPRPMNHHMEERLVSVSGKVYKVVSDLQDDRKGKHFCRHVKQEDGRCSVHGWHPFSCDFEVLRFLTRKEGSLNVLTNMCFTRGWKMTKVDGTRGILCSMSDFTRDAIPSAVHKLNRLKEWMEYFEVPHKLDKIIAWVECGPHDKALSV